MDEIEYDEGPLEIRNINVDPVGDVIRVAAMLSQTTDPDAREPLKELLEFLTTQTMIGETRGTA